MAVDDIKTGYTRLYRTVIYRDEEIVEYASRVYETPKAARYYGTQATPLDNETFRVLRLDGEVYHSAVIPNSQAEALRSAEVE